MSFAASPLTSSTTQASALGNMVEETREAEGRKRSREEMEDGDGDRMEVDEEEWIVRGLEKLRRYWAEKLVRIAAGFTPPPSPTMALASETEEGWVGLEEITRISTGPATAIEDLTGIFLDVDASTSPYGGVEAGSNTWDLTSTMIPGASLYNPLWEGFHFPLGGGEEVEGGNVSGDVPLPPLGLGLPFDEALEAANAEDAAQMGSITATPLLTTLLDPFDALAYGFHFDDLAAAPVEQPSDLSAPAEISFDAAAWDAAIRATNLGEGLVDELESEEVVVVRGTKRSRVEMVAEEAVVLSGGSGLGRPMEEEEEVIPCPRARALSPPPPSKVSLPALVGEVAPQLIPSRAIIPSTKPPHRLARAGEKRPREEDKAERREVEEERRVRTRRLLVERNGALAAQRDVAPWVRAERARNKCSKRRMAKLGWEADQEIREAAAERMVMEASGRWYQALLESAHLAAPASEIAVPASPPPVAPASPPTPPAAPVPAPLVEGPVVEVGKGTKRAREEDNEEGDAEEVAEEQARLREREAAAESRATLTRAALARLWRREAREENVRLSRQEKELDREVKAAYLAAVGESERLWRVGRERERRAEVEEGLNRGRAAAHQAAVAESERLWRVGRESERRAEAEAEEEEKKRRAAVYAAAVAESERLWRVGRDSERAEVEEEERKKRVSRPGLMRWENYWKPGWGAGPARGSGA